MENGYKTFYKGKTLEIFAETAFAAQKKAAILFKAKENYEVTVILCEKEGKPVIHKFLD